MLRACKWPVACRSRQRIHATHTAGTSPSSSCASSPPSCSHSFSSERAGAEQEDWRKVGVFWDIENCAIPAGLDPFVVRPNIERALRTFGFLGPIYLSGYANINTMCRGHTLESLTESGITIHHVPSGGRDASDRALLIDVMMWTMKHLPPAHVMLITGDSDFSVLAHKLGLLGYNVLLAAPYNNGMSSALLHAASKIWVWPDIAVGKPEGLVAETHIPGTPLPEIFTSRKKDDGSSKSSISIPEDLGYECVKGDSDGAVKANLRGGAWLPPYAVDRIVNIVKNHPGSTLGELIKLLKAININPKQYGYYDYYQCLSSMDQLETQYIDGVGMKDSVIFNLSSHIAGKRPTGFKEASDGVGCNDKHEATASVAQPECADGKKEASDGVGCNDKHEATASVVEPECADGKSLRKNSLGQERNDDASGTLGSWASRLRRFIKGS